MSTEKLAVTLMISAMHKRTIAEALWQEAEKDMAKSKELLEVSKDEIQIRPVTEHQVNC